MRSRSLSPTKLYSDESRNDVAHKNMKRKKSSKRHRRSSSSSSSSDTDSDDGHRRTRKKSSKRRRSSRSDSDDSERKASKRRKSSDKKSKKDRKHKKHEKKKKKKQSRKRSESPQAVKDVGPISGDIAPVASEPINTDAGKEQGRKTMQPMTLADYQRIESKLRHVFDPQTGRTRLVRGSGEIIEEIVSRDEQRRINKLATLGDGLSYQRDMGLL